MTSLEEKLLQELENSEKLVQQLYKELEVRENLYKKELQEITKSYKTELTKLQIIMTKLEQKL